MMVMMIVMMMTMMVANEWSATVFGGWLRRCNNDTNSRRRSASKKNNNNKIEITREKSNCFPSHMWIGIEFFCLFSETRRRFHLEPLHWQSLDSRRSAGRTLTTVSARATNRPFYGYLCVDCISGRGRLAFSGSRGRSRQTNLSQRSCRMASERVNEKPITQQKSRI